MYARVTRARDRIGRVNFWIYVLALIYAGNVLGPPPSDAHSLAIVALGIWLFPLWAEWFDRHRSPTRQAPYFPDDDVATGSIV